MAAGFVEDFITKRDAFVTEAQCGRIQATWMADISRRSYKDGVLMPLAIMALGVSGEAAEVLELFADENTGPIGRPDIYKLTNELGDTLWYIQAMIIHTDLDVECAPLRELDYDAIASAHEDRALRKISILSGKVADRIKKTAWHGMALDIQALTSDLLELSLFCYRLGACYGISYSAIAHYNMDKLNKRYPMGFVEGGGNR